MTKLLSIGLLMLLFCTVNVLLSMLAGAPAWVAFLAFVFGIVAALCVAIIAGDMDEVEVPRERKPTKAKAELLVETRKDTQEVKELESGRSLTVVRH